MESKKVVLIEGDGIGPEISQAVVHILDKAGAKIEWQVAYAGLSALDRKLEDPLPDETVELIKKEKVALKGPLTTEVGSKSGVAQGFRSINVRLRKELSLYANVRPIKTLPNLETRFPYVDMVVVRENTEGLYTGLEQEITPGVVTSLKVATRPACLRIAEYAFAYASKNNRKKVTAVHKANIMKLTDGLALECYREIANQYPDIEYEERIVDATAMLMVMHPESLDVLVMENLYGDILSDLAAGLIGGLGLAASANIGKDAALFEAVHGSAPDIAGKGMANPTALLLSACQLLQHISQGEVAMRIQNALYETFKNKDSLTADLGGKASTSDFSETVIANLK